MKKKLLDPLDRTYARLLMRAKHIVWLENKTKEEIKYLITEILSNFFQSL